MTVFVVLAVVGLVLCVLSFLLDGVFDAFEVDIGGGFLSLTSLSGGLALFGLAGTLATTTLGWGPGSAAALGAGAAAAAVLAVGALVRTLRREEPETHARVVGSPAVVTTPALPGRYGEVNLRVAGTTVKRSAVSDAPLVRGQAVRVVAEVSATAVQVVPAADA